MTKELKENLYQLIQYNWDNERINFEETFEMSISSQDSLEEWIEVCDISSNKFMCQHIFYHLMKLKQFLNN